jgi:uncharacterized protein (TIGR00251 family)
MKSQPDTSPDDAAFFSAWSAEDGTVLLPVRVVPRASTDEIVGLLGETLKVKLTAPPVKGKANHALVRLLASTFGLRKRQVKIVSGHKARLKTVRLEGLKRSAVLETIDQIQVKG